ncbi:hypothetical protein F0562_019561 [Nyssa sinensis]|uniref:Thioredoxin domain-containing protein n=1 Tax=Nyssa sinensis TaxID=561372 RepID=A0A5J5BNZ8_9ASTE|nr:hypothetical protein F0562_019561 [Nyssa sinensis]
MNKSSKQTEKSFWRERMGSALMRTCILRHLIRNRSRCPLLFSLTETLILSPNQVQYSSKGSSKPLFDSTVAPTTTTRFQLSQNFNLCRNLSSSSSGPSNIVVIGSEEEFNSSLRKAQDESLPAIFYFTAAWCGPCRLLSPIIGQLSEKYPHVTTYKIDIDQEGLGSTLSKLNIHSVPTLHLFQNGKKVSEVIGADVQRLKDDMEKLYQ